MLLTVDLIPADRHKSFYGKAKAVQLDDGTILCQSYGTFVGRLENGRFIRTWSGYSATTMRHINAFLRTFGIPGGGKAWWDSLPVEH